VIDDENVKRRIWREEKRGKELLYISWYLYI